MYVGEKVMHFFWGGGMGVGVEKVLNVCLLFAFNSHDHHNYNELFK